MIWWGIELRMQDTEGEFGMTACGEVFEHDDLRRRDLRTEAGLSTIRQISLCWMSSMEIQLTHNNARTFLRCSPGLCICTLLPPIPVYS